MRNRKGHNNHELSRIRVTVNGVVHGVGFRPFVYRCAKEKGLAGFVYNTSDGIIIEAQGRRGNLKSLVDSIVADHPPLASITDINVSEIPIAGDADFIIRESAQSLHKEPVVSPDFSLCDDCLKELFDPSNRRYRYPFINCTNCGPRFTIIKGLPYDRPLTSMASFKMCPECLSEYSNPLDRRFHAEPNACHACGPTIAWVKPDGMVTAEGNDALRACEDMIMNGHVAAVKGVGGFHIMADAFQDNAVRLIRERKERWEKPFAVIFPPGNDDILSYVKAEAFLDTEEEKAILSNQRPIVILKKREGSRLSRFISPGLDTVGAFLPYSPLHYLLLNDLKTPLVATSANFSDSPIIKDNKEALNKLSRAVDGFLMHNRDIVRRCDDSVVSTCNSKIIFIRRSRGYTPHVFKLPCRLIEPTLSVGGNQKVTIAVGWEDKAVLSQHLGDLTTEEGIRAFEEAIQDLTDFYNVKPLRIASDMHPDYLSTKWALSQTSAKHIQVQHHHAHTASCMLDNGLADKVLGISWDGTGYGPGSTIWGGEFVIADYRGFERICTFRKFRLLGGEQAIKEPGRALLSIFYEMYGEDVLKAYPFLNHIFTEAELSALLNMLRNGFNSPYSSSAGRVFDAAASLLGICHKVTYEGQGAMLLENYTSKEDNGVGYPIEVLRETGLDKGLLVFDWAPVFKAMHSDILSGSDKKIVARNFHETLSQLILRIARIAKKERGLNTVCLSGGVFQNKILVERAVFYLNSDGFNVYTHNALPPNDGGLSLGQLIVGGTEI